MLAGRTREIQAFEQAVQHGSGCLILAGAPGTGKRALLHHFEDLARGRGIDVTHHLQSATPGSVVLLDHVPPGSELPQNAVVIGIGESATWRRVPNVTLLELGNLQLRDVRELTDEQTALHVMQQTRGYPAFVSIMIRNAANELDDVVTARLAMCSESAQQLVQVGSILDHGFTFQLAQDLTDLGEDDLLDAIDDARAHDIIEQDTHGAEHYQFRYPIEQAHLAEQWSASRRSRLHRRAAEAMERRLPDQPDLASDVARQYFASRSIAGAERGIPHALAAANHASQQFSYQDAAELYGIAAELAKALPVADRSDIAWRYALALIQSLRLDEAEAATENAVALIQESCAPAEQIAQICWRLAHAMNASGSPAGISNHVQQQGLSALGSARNLAWAKLRLLDNPIEIVPNSRLYVARWVGFDADAQQLVSTSDDVEEQVQAIETFDERTQEQTRDLIRRARSWHHPFATLRAFTAAANDLMYRHGDFRGSLSIWNDVLSISQRVGALPWQANARNQIALLHLTLGEFANAKTAMELADEVNISLGPGNDAQALHMERAHAHAVYLGGDWEQLAPWFVQFVDDPPHGLETQLAVPLYASMAAYAIAMAGVGTQRVQQLIDDLLPLCQVSGVMQLNGVVAWLGGAAFRLKLADRAEQIDAAAADLMASGVGDYPQTSLELTRARMHALQKSPTAHALFNSAIETITLQGQRPLLGIALMDQANLTETPENKRQELRTRATQVFAELDMPSAAFARDLPDTSLGTVTRREREVLTFVALGYSDRRIADELFLSERTVNAHVRNMLQKAEVSNRTELTRWAQDKGLVAS